MQLNPMIKTRKYAKYHKFNKITIKIIILYAKLLPKMDKSIVVKI